MKSIVILFGGKSAEHEVSIITGLQVIEQIDIKKYAPHAILLAKDGRFLYQPGVHNRKDFKINSGKIVFLGRDELGPFFSEKKPLAKKIRIDAAYLAFHGGDGESGQVQGYLETLGIPFTSPSAEASVISMNKVLSKEVLEKNGIETVEWVRLFSRDIKENVDECIKAVSKNLKYPIIVKPAHLGSSIGISIANTKVELKKSLLEASHMDTEILVEKLVKDFTEYNCAVRAIDGEIETSEIERPINQDEILSFADKYQRGGGKKQAGGMASLVRELPAKMPKKLKEEIELLAKKAYMVLRCKGMVRIDFMVTNKGKIYLTEINPIPGSMAFYLWEASGITFTQQITDLIEQSIKDHESQKSLDLNYESDIVEKFVKG